MSEDSYRQLVRGGLSPLVGDVPPGPGWDDLASPEISPLARRTTIPGWMVGAGAAVIVVALFGVVVFLGGDRPTAVPPSSPATTMTSPATTTTGPEVVPLTQVELTLLDGTLVTLGYPSDLDLTSSGVEAATVGSLDGDHIRNVEARRETPESFVTRHEEIFGPGELAATYPGADGGVVERWEFPGEPLAYLVYDFDPWTVFVWDGMGGANTAMGEEAERAWAANLHGAVDPLGFLLLTADPPLELIDAADARGPDGPDVRIDGSSGSLLVFINDCDRMTRLDEETYGQEVFAFCDEPTNTLFFVAGDAGVQERVHTFLEVVDLVAPSVAEPSVSLPFEVDDLFEPRPVAEDLLVSGDWTQLDSGPLTPRWSAVRAWTGEEIVIWGGERIGGGAGFGDGAAFNVTTGEWRMLADSPLPPASEAGWVWTEDELVIWSGMSFAAAWKPDTNTWRTIEDWPLAAGFYRRAVWTGEEIIDADRGLAVNPETGESRSIGDPPALGDRASVVWADGYLVSVTGEGAYDANRDEWADMPDSGLTPLATAGASAGGLVVAVDYEMGAAAYDPERNTWTPYPDLPLRFSECSPRAHTLKGQPVAQHCSGIGVWDSGRQMWIPLAYPIRADHTLDVFSTGETLYAWGREGFYELNSAALDNPKRVVAGIGLFDIPDDWSLTSTQASPTLLTLESTAGDTCTVTATHRGAQGILFRYMSSEPIVVDLNPHVGGTPYKALRVDAGSLDEHDHLVWATGTTDVIDVACPGEGLVEQLAPRIWTEHQSPDD